MLACVPYLNNQHVSWLQVRLKINTTKVWFNLNSYNFEIESKSIQELKVDDKAISNNDFPDARSFQCIIITVLIKKTLFWWPKKTRRQGSEATYYN